MASDTCKHCGGDRGIHRFDTEQCPVGGREAPIGKMQEWQKRTFESQDSELDIVSLIKNNLEISISLDGYNDHLIRISLLWDGKEIDHDTVQFRDR